MSFKRQFSDTHSHFKHFAGAYEDLMNTSIPSHTTLLFIAKIFRS